MTTSEQKKFIIGDRSFYMVPITLGQLEHLLGVVVGLTFPPTPEPMAIVQTLADRLPKALACVLVPDGQTPGAVVKTLDAGGLEELAQFMRGEVSFETAVEVAAFFFDVNPISSISSKLVVLAKQIGAAKTALPTLDGKPSTPSCPGETSASAPVSARA